MRVVDTWPSIPRGSPYHVDLLTRTVSALGSRATVSIIDVADHSFHAPAKTGRKDAEVLAEILNIAAAWMAER